MSKASSTLVRRQFKDLTQNGISGISAGLVDDNIYEWEVLLIGPQDTPYEGGFFKARMSFPLNYPLSPPTVRFITPVFHPNVYKDGRVCISILHPPGDDEYGYEDACERWLPIHTAESILVSIISMFSSPNPDSPANIEAASLMRKDPKEFRKRVRRCVRDTQDDF